MLASYLLSRTLVPTMVHYLLRREVDAVQRRATSTRRRPRGSIWRDPRRFNRRFEAMRERYQRCLGLVACDHRARGSVAFDSSSRRPCCSDLRSSAHDFFPAGGCRPDPAARARARGHAHRGDRAHIRARWRRAIREMIPADELDTHPRQHRAAERRAQPRPSATRDDRPCRRRDPGFAQAREHRSHRRNTCETLRRQLTAKFPEDDLLLPAGRHREPDPELRAAGADRRSGDRRDNAQANYAIAHSASAAHGSAFRAPSTCMCTRR